MSALKRIEQSLIKRMNNIGACACTFYVRDPYWTDEFRLVFMPGVQYKEPMHGLTFPPSARRVITEGEDFLFKQASPSLLNQQFGGIDPAVRHLFGNFTDREGIKCYYRLKHVDRELAKAVLFVNFKRHRVRTPALDAEARSMLSLLTKELDTIVDELKVSDTTTLAEAIQLIQPARSVTVINAAELLSEDRRKQFFQELLKSSFAALGIPPQESVGTVHLYDPAKHTLTLDARVGKCRPGAPLGPRSVSRGKGIVSWVALRRRAILVSDLNSSKFKPVYMSINGAIQSELAVPMIAGGRILGVLNLESTQPRAFSAASVRSLWCAANHAAAVLQMSREAELTQRMTRLVIEARNGKAGERDVLDQLAGMAASWLDASKCDIWRHDKVLRVLAPAGASYHNPQLEVRKGGWSNWVYSHKRAVWISGIKSPNSFEAAVLTEGKWARAAIEDEVPTTLNPRLLEIKARAELGVPITSGSNCIGVAWVKYTVDRPAPAEGVMDMATYFVTQGALVMEAVQHQQDQPLINALAEFGGKIQPCYYPPSKKLDFPGLPFLEGFAIHRPFRDNFCGDFHSVSPMPNGCVSLLAGDAIGHGVSGLLYLLPTLAAFEAVSRYSRSAGEVTENLAEVCRLLNVQGEVVYVVFKLIDKDLWCSYSCAGAMRLHLLRCSRTARGLTEYPSNADSPAAGGWLGRPVYRPYGEEYIRLHEGDVILICTDGVTGDPEGAHEKLWRVVENLGPCSAEYMAEAIMDSARADATSDDQSVIVVRMTREPAASPPSARASSSTARSTISSS